MSRPASSRPSAAEAVRGSSTDPLPGSEHGGPPGSPVTPAAPLAARRRLLAAGAAWAMLLLAQPGLGRPQGFGHWAFVALAPWGLYCSRPGPRAFLVEWLVASFGLAGFAAWMHHLLPWLVPFMGMVPALYVAGAGVLLRRLARRWPLALAVPAAWMAGELVRWNLGAPFSFGWWRLGTMAHASTWMRGSASVWGVWGLSWVFAAFGGWLADLMRVRRLGPLEPWPHAPRTVHLLGLGPLALCLALCIFVRPPSSEPGPRVMVVQPGIEQELKSFGLDPFADLFADMCGLTAAGLAEARAEGEPEPDLVAWGETMFPWDVLGNGTREAFDAGARPPAFARSSVSERYLEQLPDREEALIGGVLFGRREAVLRYPWDAGGGASLVERLREQDQPWARAALAGQPLLPPGTSLVAGARVLVARAGELRRENATVLWGGDGRRLGYGAKVHLVPGAEDPRGFQRVGFLLDVMERVGGYVPDFVPAPEAAVLGLATREGAAHRFGVSVCYDNAFDDPYTAPLRRERLDFHVVLSNEAWYEDGVEMDHMIAFSRLIAAMTGRSLVRVTNSGISCVLDPTGADVARLEVDGRAKMVRGTLRASVPVPVRDASGRAPRTVYVLTGRWQIAGWILLVALLAAFSGRGRNQEGHPG